MVRLTLLDRARAAGLTVAADGDRLVIRGPRRAGPIVRELMDNKAEVLAALAGSAAGAPPLPTDDAAVQAGLDWHRWRSARIRAERALPAPEADRLAHLELVEHLATPPREPGGMSWDDLAARRWGPSTPDDPSLDVAPGFARPVVERLGDAGPMPLGTHDPCLDPDPVTPDGRASDPSVEATTGPGLARPLPVVASLDWHKAALEYDRIPGFNEAAVALLKRLLGTGVVSLPSLAQEGLVSHCADLFTTTWRSAGGPLFPAVSDAALAAALVAEDGEEVRTVAAALLVKLENDHCATLSDFWGMPEFPRFLYAIQGSLAEASGVHRS